MYTGKNKEKTSIIVNKIYSSDIGRWIWSAIITTLMFLVTSILFNRTFYTNDDENVMYTLAGYYTNGIPYDHHFINVLLSKFIRVLYEVDENIPWYSLFH